MSFHLIGTNGFYINADKERFTTAGSRCRKFTSFTHMIKKKHVLSALCALKVCAFKACLIVRLLTRFIAIDVELEIIDAQKICNGLVFYLFCFPLFY